MADLHTRPIAFTRGVPATESFPTSALLDCQEVVFGAGAPEVLHYGHHAGYMPLREQIAHEYGVGVPEVLVSNGSMQILDLFAGCFIQPGALVITEQPTYDRTVVAFRRHGARVVGVPVEADGLDVERLEALLKREGKPAFLYVISDFQNPTGVTMSLAKRRAVLELAERYDFSILEDTPYRRLRYQGEHVPMLRELNPARVTLMSSYAKLISPGIRVGFAVGPAEVVKKLVDLAIATYLAPVLPTQATVAEFMRRGLLEPHIERLLALYRPKWQAAVTACAKYLPEADVMKPEGGFYVGITLPEQARLDGLVERAAKVHLSLTDGRLFFADADGANSLDGSRFVRLPFCALEPDEIDEGVRRLAALL